MKMRATESLPGNLIAGCPDKTRTLHLSQYEDMRFIRATRELFSVCFAAGVYVGVHRRNVDQMGGVRVQALLQRRLVLA
jgi:hypothetical protein